MTFKIVTPGFEQDYERWTDALEKANSLRPSLKSWFKDIRILEDGKPVWTYGRGRKHPEYLGPGTYDRLRSPVHRRTNSSEFSRTLENSRPSLRLG